MVPMLDSIFPLNIYIFQLTCGRENMHELQLETDVFPPCNCVIAYTSRGQRLAFVEA